MGVGPISTLVPNPCKVVGLLGWRANILTLSALSFGASYLSPQCRIFRLQHGPPFLMLLSATQPMLPGYRMAKINPASLWKHDWTSDSDKRWPTIRWWCWMSPSDTLTNAFWLSSGKSWTILVMFVLFSRNPAKSLKTATGAQCHPDIKLHIRFLCG